TRPRQPDGIQDRWLRRSRPSREIRRRHSRQPCARRMVTRRKNDRHHFLRIQLPRDSERHHVADPSKSRVLYSTHDDVGAPVWLPDGNALIVVIRDRTGSNRGQIWSVSYPDGQAHRLSNDLTNYSLPWLGLSRDATSLATIENNRTADLWLVPDADANRAHQITSGGSLIRSIAPFGKDRFLFLTDNGELSSISADGS